MSRHDDARVAAYWGAEEDWDAPADGDGNPIHPTLRAEVDAERERIRSAGILSHLD